MNKFYFSLTGCGLFLLLLFVIPAVVIGLFFWTDRTLDFWCTYCSGHTVNVPFWLSALVTLIGNGVMFILNIISEIVRLCI